MHKQNKIKFSFETLNKLNKLNKIKARKEIKFHYLLPFRKYNVDKQVMEMDGVINEIYNILVKYEDTENLIYGFKIKE